MDIPILILASTCISLVLIILMICKFQWTIEQIRQICSDERGYVKLIQLAFVIFILFTFCILLIDSFIARETTSKLDLFLTVIVGLMGTIMGAFFSERAMESIKQRMEFSEKDRAIKQKGITAKQKKLEHYKKQLEIIDRVLRKID